MIGIQFKMYSAVGRYRKNSYGGDSNAMGFEREGFSSMSAKIFLGEGMRYPNPVLTALNIDYGLTHGKLVRVFTNSEQLAIRKFDFKKKFCGDQKVPYYQV